MTNREKLMEELAGLSGYEFFRAMADNHTTMAIDRGMCADCEELFAYCPLLDREDQPCRLTVEAWLDMPCRRERMLT